MILQGGQRRYSGWDRLTLGADAVLRTLVGRQIARRPYPARPAASVSPPSPDSLDSPDSLGSFDAFGSLRSGASPSSSTLSASDRRISQGCMRVNHSGEVCAQALYEGQLLVAREQKTRDMLLSACEEEKDHLAWTHQRLQSLGTHRSYLNVFWYTGAFLIGVLAGLLGDRWSMGFVEETERQVEAHLEGHLSRLPEHDHESRAIVAQMRLDEAEHGASAQAAGAYALPVWVRELMRLQAAVMIRVAYWI